MGVLMSQASHVEAASRHAPRANKDTGRKREDGERFTPLLTRETHTFSCMRRDQRGPRMVSTICSPRWKQI